MRELLNLSVGLIDLLYLRKSELVGDLFWARLLQAGEYNGLHSCSASYTELQT